MDISQLVNELLQALGVVLLGFALYGAKWLGTYLGIKVTAEQATMLDQIAENALDWAIARASSAIAAKGWDHPDVKSQILAAALNYAQQNAQGGLQKAGIDTSSQLSSAEGLAPIIERSFADAMGRAAASPATPPASPVPVAAPASVPAVGPVAP